MSQPLDVHNYNAYGGGVGTIGKVAPGNELTLDGSFEYSVVQNWVIACDFVYKSFDRTTFSGTPGVDTTGATAVIGGDDGYQFSVAPALEYNPSEGLQFIAGPWFTVTGKNAVAFVNILASVCMVF